MRIKDMPDNNRPRERFLKYGAEVWAGTVSDVAVVYGGAVFSFVTEKFKDYINRK